MNDNPFQDLAERRKQQTIDQRLQTIETYIKSVTGETSMKLIELEVAVESGPYNVKKTVSLNPECVVYIEDGDAEHCYVHTTDNSTIQVLKSRDELIKLISGDSNTSKEPTYIK